VSDVAGRAAPVSDVAGRAAPVSDVAGRAAPVSEPLHVSFICSGNICRSPMAEKMFAHQIKARGLSDAVRVTSAGTGGWHAGDPADQRASAVLHAHGYPSAHRATEIDNEHMSADLVVALGRNHVRMLREMGVQITKIRMLRSFDPRSAAHALDVDDPYYGTHDDFEVVFTVIEAALPGLHDWVDEQLAGRGIES
jgi:protein-tyrosine phosphatase